MRIPDGELLLRIAFLDLPLMAMFFSYDGALTGRRQFSVLAAAQVAYGLIKLAGILVLIGIGISVERALVAYVLSTGIACGAAGRPLPQPRTQTQGRDHGRDSRDHRADWSVPGLRVRY